VICTRVASPNKDPRGRARAWPAGFADLQLERAPCVSLCTVRRSSQTLCCCRYASSCARTASGVASRVAWACCSAAEKSLPGISVFPPASDLLFVPSMLSLPLISQPAPRPAARLQTSESTDRSSDTGGNSTFSFPRHTARAPPFFAPQSSLIASTLSCERSSDCDTLPRDQQRPVTAPPLTLAPSDEFAHDHPDHASCVIADRSDDEDDGPPLDLLHPRFRVQLHFHLGLNHRE
jgi:hypothetical protein